MLSQYRYYYLLHMWLTVVSVARMNNKKPVIPVLKFGDRLRVVRREYLNRSSQQEIADLLGVPRERYSQWEAGNSEPRPAEARRIAKLIEQQVGVSAAWLLGVQEDDAPGPLGDGGTVTPWPVSKVSYLSDRRVA